MNLAVKYRPKTFKDVVNQKHVVITLQNALATLNIARKGSVISNN